MEPKIFTACAMFKCCDFFIGMIGRGHSIIFKGCNDLTGFLDYLMSAIFNFLSTSFAGRFFTRQAASLWALVARSTTIFITAMSLLLWVLTCLEALFCVLMLRDLSTHLNMYSSLCLIIAAPASVAAQKVSDKSWTCSSTIAPQRPKRNYL